MPARPGWAWGWRGDALCFTGKEFGQACQTGWDNPGRMRWGFAAEQQGLSGLLTDPCIWEITESSGRAWKIWVGWSDALSSPSAGAYYPAQGVQQFSAGVPTAQVIVSQQPPIPPKRERKTVRSHLPPGMGVLVCRRGMVSAPGAGGVWDGMWCSMSGKRVGTGLCPHGLEGSARKLGCMVGAGDLGRPGGQCCAESRLPEGGGAVAANCCLLPEMPVLRGLAWGLFIAGSRVAAGMALC